MRKNKLFSGLLACTLFSSFFAISPKAAAAEPKQKDVELVCVIDKSGSMHRLQDDTIGSFNSVIEEQKNSKEKNEVYVTTVMFNHKHEKVHDRKNIKDLKKLTKEEYSPSGCTALYDALGDTINGISKNKCTKENKVIFAIITDGYENASKEYKKADIKKLINEKTKDGWEFIFLGANIDSAKEGGGINIGTDRTRNFDASGKGVQAAFSMISTAVRQTREGKTIDLDEPNTKEKNTPKETQKA